MDSCVILGSRFPTSETYQIWYYTHCVITKIIREFLPINCYFYISTFFHREGRWIPTFSTLLPRTVPVNISSGHIRQNTSTSLRPVPTFRHCVWRVLARCPLQLCRCAIVLAHLLPSDDSVLVVRVGIAFPVLNPVARMVLGQICTQSFARDHVAVLSEYEGRKREEEGSVCV